MGQLFAYIAHNDGVLDDTALELVAAAKAIDAGAAVTALVIGSGVDAVATEAAASYAEVWKIDGDAFAYPNAEVIRKALVNMLPADAMLLLPHDTFGIDLSPGLSIKLDSSFVSDVVSVDGMDGTTLKLVRQEFGGMASTHVATDVANGVVLNIRPGTFQPDESKAAGGSVVDKSGDVGDIAANRTYIETVIPEAGDVDITKSEILVSVGRGIEDQDNLEIVDELAEAMGADVACSRPIVDAKWMEKSRQVGTSGVTVKPKVYLACGISGSFQHVGGIKGSPFMVAINKNPKAPIFQVADVGIVEDILDFLPELTEKISE